MGNILLCGLVMTLFIRLFCSIERNFAFDVFTIVLIIGMIYYLIKNGMELLDIILLGLATIITIIVTIVVLLIF